MIKRFIYRLLISLFLGNSMFTAVANNNANNNQLHFRQLTTNDGLAQNTVDCMLKDSRGFMWFATWNGLCRFDGYSFETFQKQQISLLPSNRIQSLCEDTAGNIWVGTKAGLALFNYDHFQFLPINKILRNTSIIHIISDKQGTIWVATHENGLWQITSNGQNGFQARRILSNQLASRNINHLLLTSQDIWIGTDNGLEVYDKNTHKLNPDMATIQKHLAGISIQTIYADSRQQIWIGTTHAGVYRFDRQAKILNYYGVQTNSTKGLSHASVRDITEDKNHKLIIGTLGGLNYYHSETDNFSVNKSLSNPFVNSLLADDDGNVWIGTEKGGVAYYSTLQKPFHAIMLEPEKINSITHNTVNSIWVEKNNIWIGTAGGGLNRVTSHEVNKYRYSEQNPQSLNSDFVSAIFRDKQHNLWVGTWGGGLNKLIDEKNQRFKVLNNNPNNRNSLSSNFISCITALNDRQLLIGTRSGVDIFTGSTERFTPISQKLALNKELHVGCMLNDNKNNVWVGTENGLYRFKKQDLENLSSDSPPLNFNLFIHNNQTVNSLADNYIISLFEASNGDIWIGTYGSGICKYVDDNFGGHFLNFTEADGLCNNVIYGIEEDKKGNLWLSTDNGLSCFNPKTKHIQNYHQNDGLLSNQFYWSASFADTQGTLYFGSINGLNYFSPQEIQASANTPKPIFTNLSIFGKPVQVGKAYHSNIILNKPISDSKQIRLSYKDAIFSIEFSALDYFLSEKIKYAYQMEGIDHDWIVVPASRRFANYTNLSGGKYTFKVKASNSDGVWNEKPISLTIYITPPFWKTIWFQLLIIASLLTLGLLYIQYRTRRLHKQKAALEKLVHERTYKIEEQNTELERQNQQISKQRDELLELNKEVKRVNGLRLRFFTNISHEFRTPLTLITAPLEQLMTKHDKNEEDYHTLDIINRNAQRLLHLINQLLHFRKVETSGLRLQIGEGKLSSLVQRIFDSFNELATHRNINFVFHTENEPESCWFDADKIENILYNLLSNAFKHTPALGSIQLQIDFHTSTDKEILPSPFVSIKVIDSGNGISKEHIVHIFDRFYKVGENESESFNNSGIGLDLTAEMVKALHGKITVDSVLGRGSCFCVYLPYTPSAFNKDELISDAIPPNFNMDKHVKMLTRQMIANQPKEEISNNIDTSKQDNSDKSSVLIVEDNADLRHFLAGNLSGNYHIFEAKDGKEAVKIAQQYSPELIISDVMMPSLNGIEMCRMLKKDIATSHIPIILLTAKDLIENYLEGLDAGADDYIAKPFNFSILRAKIRNIIASRERVKQLLSSPNPVPPQEVSNNKVDEEFITRAYQILENNLTNTNFSAEQFAQEMLVSKSLLYKKIKSLTELSITDFINTYKLKKAVKLMDNADMTIAEIAFNSGFNDPKYFSRLFRKFYQMSPSDYIKMNAPI
ncbi:MAG: two-component regulator propeller domain-containing protein [Mangrovibacterium sp.]